MSSEPAVEPSADPAVGPAAEPAGDPAVNPVVDPSADPGADAGAAADWQRLNPRMLLLDPVKILGQALVPGLAFVVGVSSSGNARLLLFTPLIVLGALLLGAVPWLTTYYRLDARQLQVRRGLLNKKTSTAPLDRVRSVDLEASLLHRVLGLRKVQIGTGVDDERIELDAVSAVRADELRGLLLTHRAGPGAPSVPAQAGAGGVATDADAALADTLREPQAPERVLASIDWTWLRFAPFSLSRLVIVAGALGFLGQFADDLPVLDAEHLRSAWEWATGVPVALAVPVTLVAALLAWVVISVAGYVAQWWNLRLTREHGSLHLSSGLLTTRAISVEEQRIRGVQLKEPVLLRLVDGAELSTLATGVQSGVTGILPPCPVVVATDVGGEVLEDAAPLRVPLRQHGGAARRRAHLRAQDVTLALALVALLLEVVGSLERRTDWLPGWLPWTLVGVTAALGLLLAESTYAHLGHALTPGHLVAGSGMTTRTRTVLEREGVIGWVVTQSLFQRRAGLATLVATTAAGAERVVVRDVPHDRALALAFEVTPGPLKPFLAETAH